MLYPRVDAVLFSAFRGMMVEHRAEVDRSYRLVTGDPIRAKTVEGVVRLFMEERLRFVHVMLENVGRWEKIAHRV
jgi:hypothetical protein